jgi:hypothetical protein
MDDLTVATGSGDGSRDGVLVERSATAASSTRKSRPLLRKSPT